MNYKSKHDLSYKIRTGLQIGCLRPASQQIFLEQTLDTSHRSLSMLIIHHYFFIYVTWSQRDKARQNDAIVCAAPSYPRNPTGPQEKSSETR